MATQECNANNDTGIVKQCVSMEVIRKFHSEQSGIYPFFQSVRLYIMHEFSQKMEIIFSKEAVDTSWKVWTYASMFPHQRTWFPAILVIRTSVTFKLTKCNSAPNKL